MARPGRPRQAGERHPSGDLVRPVERDPTGNAGIIARRALLLGAIVDPRSVEASYPLGIMRVRGLIGDAEHDAGQRFAAGEDRKAAARLLRENHTLAAVRDAVVIGEFGQWLGLRSVEAIRAAPGCKTLVKGLAALAQHYGLANGQA